MINAAASARRVLIVLVVVILAAFCVVQAINRPAGTDTTTYRAEFTDAFGLHKNADVRIRGVRVGKVGDVSLTEDGTAMVEFELQRGEAIDSADRLAIKFQNLVGQRYIAIDRGEPERELPRNATVELDHTTGSFDVTRMFNGLKPILRGADPAVFNKFAQNLISLIQGDDGVGIGTVLKDVDRLSSFAVDRTELIRVIVANLGTVSEQLSGNSEIIDVLVNNMNILFGTFADNEKDLIDGFERGSVVFPELVDVLNRTAQLGLGGHDRIDTRIMELAPGSAPMGESLKAIPGMLDQMNQLLDGLDSNLTCSNGRVRLPDMAGVLLAGGKVTLCRR